MKTADYPDAATTLASLGNDADAVAATLTRCRFTGYRMDPGGCPVAGYLSTFIDGVCNVSVGTTTATLYGRSGHAVIDLPPPVVQFVERFDDSLYPALIEDDESEPELVDTGGYLACGCHGSQSDHTCGPLD